jgi:hypothetical protein
MFKKEKWNSKYTLQDQKIERLDPRIREASILVAQLFTYFLGHTQLAPLRTNKYGS